MVSTALNSNSPPKRHFWITEAAISNWRDKVKHFSTLSEDKLSLAIDDMVHKAITAGSVEQIVDVDEEARLVQLAFSSAEVFFALVKKSVNPANGEYAVVTIMTPFQVTKKRESQAWTRAGFGLKPEDKKALSAVKPAIPRTVTPNKPLENKASEQQPVGGERPDTYLISYMPFKKAGEYSARVQEEYGTLEEISDRMNEIKIVPGTLRAYKQLPIGYRIIDE